MFLNATMLAGLAGAVLPLVLHLLNRARYRNVRWGAMMFLADGESRPSRSTRLREWTLLGLRMAIVALLAIALARPVLGPVSVSANVDNPACVVIIVDRSGSMFLDDNGQQRINPARRAVLSLLAGLRRGDEAALVYAPEWPQHPPLLTTDLAGLAAQAGEVRPFSARADMSAALGAAARVLGSSRADDKRLVIVCDRQASSWRDVTDAFASTWRHVLGNPPGSRPPRVSIIPVGSTEAGNVAVESVRPVNPPIIRDAPAEIEVRITNYDTLPRTSLPLALWAGGAPIHQTSVNIDAGATLAWRCPVRLSMAGSTVLSARIGGADLGFDDFLECAFDVIDPIGVLIISGDEREGESMRSESAYLRLALAPFASAGQAGPDPAAVEVVSWEQWPELDRARHRVVVLANVPRLSPAQVRQIEQYVYGGGGLLIAPGNLSSVEEYDAQLWRDGSGVLPAELDAPTAADGSQATTLLGLELTHPLFAFLQGRPDPLPSVHIARGFPVRGSEAGGRVLGRYASGMPFVIEGAFGRGRVLLFTTPLDADWSNLPLGSFYLPMVQSAVRYLASGTMSDRNVRPGEPMIALIEGATESRARLHGPGDFQAPIDMVRLGVDMEARFSGATRPGTYRLEYQTARGARSIHFCLRPVREESDLAALDEGQWDRLRRLLEADVLEDDPPQAAARALAGTHTRRELWAVLLAAVIALALLEMGLGRAWTAAQEARA